MRSLTFCAICLLAVAAGLAVYEALNAWAGESAWAYARRGQDSIRPTARRGVGLHAGPARLWSRAVEALAGFAPLSMRERERSRERLRCAGIALEPETWRCVCFAAVSGCVVIAVAACIALRAAPAVFVFVVCGAGLAGCGGLRLYLRSKRQARRAAIDAGLPDAMELLGVAIAAGSPVEQCFRQVAESLSGPLADEFRLVDQEVNLLGHSRAKALSNLAQRCASPGGHCVRRSADPSHRAGRLGGAGACQSSCACPFARTGGGARTYQEDADEARCGAVRLLFAAYHVAGARSHGGRSAGVSGRWAGLRSFRWAPQEGRAGRW